MAILTASHRSPTLAHLAAAWPKTDGKVLMCRRRRCSADFDQDVEELIEEDNLSGSIVEDDVTSNHSYTFEEQPSTASVQGTAMSPAVSCAPG